MAFVPVPPSKARHDPLHDDRVARMLRAIWSGRPADIREIIIQSASTAAAHESPVRPAPRQIAGWYRIDEALTDPEPASVAIVDDVLTTGAHFRGGEHRVGGMLPGCADHRAVHRAEGARYRSGVLTPRRAGIKLPMRPASSHRTHATTPSRFPVPDSGHRRCGANPDRILTVVNGARAMTCFEPMNEPPFCRAGMRTGRESPRDLQPQRRPAGPGPERNEPAGGGRTRGAGWPRRCTRARSATAPAAPTSTDPSRHTRPRSATASGAAKARSEDSSTGPARRIRARGVPLARGDRLSVLRLAVDAQRPRALGRAPGSSGCSARRVHGPVSRRRRRGLPSEDGRDGRRHGTGESEAGRGESRSVAAGDPAGESAGAGRRPAAGGQPDLRRDRVPPDAGACALGDGADQRQLFLPLTDEVGTALLDYLRQGRPTPPSPRTSRRARRWGSRPTSCRPEGMPRR